METGILMPYNNEIRNHRIPHESCGIQPGPERQTKNRGQNKNKTMQPMTYQGRYRIVDKTR